MSISFDIILDIISTIIWNIPDTREDDLTGFLALLTILATSSKGFHSTSDPSNNFSKKVRLFFMVFFFIVPRRVGFSPPLCYQNGGQAHPTFTLNFCNNLINLGTQAVNIGNSFTNLSIEFININYFSGIFFVPHTNLLQGCGHFGRFLQRIRILPNAAHLLYWQTV